VGALRCAGPNPTRKKFITAMENMRKHDLGGMLVSFSAGDLTLPLFNVSLNKASYAASFD
jgi:hypothetical protein